MPDKRLIKTGITGSPHANATSFKKGQSGNPKGRPRGAYRAGTRAAAALLDAQAEALAQKALELAFGGDPVAVRFCLGRILGVRRGQPVELALPEIAAPGDLAGAAGAIIAAVADGSITPDEALSLSQTLDGFPRVFAAAGAASAAAPEPVPKLDPELVLLATLRRLLAAGALPAREAADARSWLLGGADAPPEPGGGGGGAAATETAR